MQDFAVCRGKINFSSNCRTLKYELSLIVKQPLFRVISCKNTYLTLCCYTLLCSYMYFVRLFSLLRYLNGLHSLFRFPNRDQQLIVSSPLISTHEILNINE